MGWEILIDNDFGQPFSWFSFEDAMKRASAGYLQISDAGCLIDDNLDAPLRNCSLACLYNDGNVLNPVWGSKWSPFTLQNCLMYPYIAFILATESRDSIPSDFLIEQYGILPDENISIDSWPVINNCLDSFCAIHGEDVPGCNATWHDQWSYAGTGLARDQDPTNVTLQLFPNASYAQRWDNAITKLPGNSDINLPWVRETVESLMSTVDQGT